MIRRIRFLKDFTGTINSNYCCFTGSHDSKIETFMEGEVYSFDVIEQASPVQGWFKPRRKPQKLFTFFILNHNKDLTHADDIKDIPEDVFEFVSDFDVSNVFEKYVGNFASGIPFYPSGMPIYGSGMGYYNQLSEGSEIQEGYHL